MQLDNMQQNNRKKGKLYGVGVGPGDPELLTIKAVRIINECKWIAVPGMKKEETAAYQIVSGVIPELSGKPCLEIEMPMTKDAGLLQSKHEEGCRRLAGLLDTGENVAFLTLGDPTVYATYFYLHKMLEKAGYEAEIINGIPSFCAVAAKMDISLGEKSEQIHIIPSSYELEEAVHLKGTKIFMKAGKKFSHLKELLQKEGGEVYMAENCMMPGEKIYRGVENLPEEAGYYTLTILKS